MRKEAQECIEYYVAQQRNKTVSSGQRVVEEEECLPTVVVERQSEKALEGGDIHTVAEVMEQEASVVMDHVEGERASQIVVNEESAYMYMANSQSSAMPGEVGDVVTPKRNMEVEQRGINAEEEEKVAKFHSDGCGCAKKCSLQFTLEHIREVRADMAQLDRTALDMTIMGQVMAFTNCSQATIRSITHYCLQK